MPKILFVYRFKFLKNKLCRAKNKNSETAFEIEKILIEKLEIFFSLQNYKLNFCLFLFSSPPGSIKAYQIDQLLYRFYFIQNQYKLFFSYSYLCVHSTKFTKQLY